MSCERVRDQMLDLPADELASVAHLRTCADCRAWAARIVEVDEAIASRAECFATGAPFEPAWAHATHPPAPRRTSMSWSFHATLVALAAAAALLLTLLPIGEPAPDERAAVVPTPDTVLVMVAARDVPAGTVLTEHHLYAVEAHPDMVPRGAYRSPEPLVGQVVAEPLLENEFIRCERLEGNACGDQEEAPREITVAVGMSVLMDIPWEPWSVVVDSSTVTVVPMGRGDLLRVIGVSPGVATVHAQWDGGEGIYPVRVVAPLAPSPVPPDDDAIIWLRVGETLFVPSPLAVTHTVSVTDEALVTHRRVDGGVELRGIRAGVTDLWFTNETTRASRIVQIAP